MKKLTPAGLVFAIGILIFGNLVIAAQTYSGTWTSRPHKGDSDGEKIQLTFRSNDAENERHSYGSTFKYSDLKGLSLETARDGAASFRLEREAGTIECKGNFTDGKGAGTFVFTPNSSFIAGMRSRGFDFEKKSEAKYRISPEKRLFTAAALDVTLALADELRSANFPNLDVDDLFKAKIFKIDGKFLVEMAASGYPNISMEDVVKARIFKIDGEYIRSLQGVGFGTGDFDDLVKYKIFKVTPEFLNELRAEGLTDLAPEDVVQLRIFKIDAAFVRQARAAAPDISIKSIVNKKLGFDLK